jgi:hypothetical protein
MPLLTLFVYVRSISYDDRALSRLQQAEMAPRSRNIQSRTLNCRMIFLGNGQIICEVRAVTWAYKAAMVACHASFLDLRVG